MTKYWTINNAEGKTWIIPLKNSKVALQLYQPSGRNGKILKAMLPFFAPFASVWSPFPVSDGDVDPDLIAFLSNLFPEKDLTFSFFLGTPSVHKKSTIQVAKGKNILAYCKTSSNPAVVELFNREQAYLQWLACVGVKHVPVCLFNGKVDGFDQQVFVMSTEKDDNSVVEHEWSAAHDAFLADLVSKTGTSCVFEESDYGKYVAGLKARISDLPDGVNANVVGNVLNDIFGKFGGKSLDMVAMHGDFTPWNMFLQGRHLFVFDWEYALRTTPVNLDRYHFFTQHNFFESHWNAEQMVQYMATEEGKWIKKDDYKMYIVLIMSVFLSRENGKCQLTPLFQLWNDLLVRLS